MRRAAAAAALLCAPPPCHGAPVPALGPYKVKSDKFTVGTLVAGGQQAAIYYPEADAASGEVFNVLSFGHGFGSGEPLFDPQYSPLLSTLASYGFVVLAPLSCPTSFCDLGGATDFSHDILGVLSAGKAKPSLHPGLSLANFSAVGVVGHSMGGTAAGTAAGSPAGLPVAAYVGLHGTPVSAPTASPIHVPTMYTTGGADKIVAPIVVKNAFNITVNAHPRVIAELSDATHFEPSAAGGKLPGGQLRLNPYVAQFMRCHVSSDQGACALVYDAANPQSLCNAYKDKFAAPKGECVIAQ